MEHLLRATAMAEARHFWFRGFRRFVTPLIRTALTGVAHPLILDCGCGTGANLELLDRFGRSFGFDLTEVGLQIGRREGRRRLTRASVVAVPFPSGAFDLATSFDVLYSLEDHHERAALAEMYRVLKPGGYVMINVAAMEVLRGDHSVLGHEIRRYDRARLHDRLTGAGFSIVRLTYTNTSLSLPLMIVRTFQRWRGLKPEHEAHREITVPLAPLNAFLSGVLWLESLWIRSFDAPFGSSLLCLARKPDS